MDDVLVLAPTRWKLRRAVKAVNEVLGSLRLEKHPDKTYVGRIEKDFDFLGYLSELRLIFVSAASTRFMPAALQIRRR